jgi:Glycosyl transferase family 2
MLRSLVEKFRKRIQLAIGITTYNRKRLVDAHARSLRGCQIPLNTTITVIDDASSEYDVDFLKSIFPNGTAIVRRAVNSGDASIAARDLMERLVTSGAGNVMLLDSDLIVRSDFIPKALDMLARSDGIVSIINAHTHLPIRCFKGMVEKSTLGAAGTLWRNKLAAQVLNDVLPGPRWDWRFSEYLKSSGIRMFSAEMSLAQHIGFRLGQHSGATFGDIGLAFEDADPRNAYILAEALMFELQESEKATAEVRKLLSIIAGARSGHRNA